MRTQLTSSRRYSPLSLDLPSTGLSIETGKCRLDKVTKEHTVTKLRQLLQEAEASLSELRSLTQYLDSNTSTPWGVLYLGGNSYFAILQSPTVSSIEKLTELLKARGFSFKRVSGRNALDLLRKVASSQETKMDRRILKTLHARAAEGKLYKVTRGG